ncbi:M6 family metalloprotease domain-containing protein, partial [bacterium]|nr:M6 family metalloprotease domain-containing protein [bacterium]
MTSKTLKISVITIIAIIFTAFNTAYAIMPPHPDLIKQWKEQGIFEKKIKELAQMSDRLMGGSRLESDIYGKYLRPIAHEGKLKALIVLVEFPKGNPLLHLPASTKEYYEKMLFNTGTLNNKWPTFRDFYLQNSRGKLDITGSVVGWYKAEKEIGYYSGGNGGTQSNSRTGELIDEALDYAAEQFNGDLTQFDNDGPDGIPNSGDDDGLMDVFLVVHAGKGSESAGDAREDSFHSHYSPGFGKKVGGVQVWGYCLEGEFAGSAQDYFPGVFIHECGHWFGLPDLYDYGYDSSGVGGWSMMAAGSWYCSSFDAWSKTYLGWYNEEDGSLINVCSDTDGIVIPDIHRDDGVIYRMWTFCQESPEYFLVENRERQPSGVDRNQPGNGLLIWHVDESIPAGRPNDDQEHPLLKLLQCDGRDDLYYYRNSWDGTDPWPCGEKDFSAYSNPSSRSYNDEDTLVVIRNISDPGDVMVADFEVGVLSEGIQVISYKVNDIFGNGDGIPNPGEEIYLRVKLLNNSGPQTNVSATISTTNPVVIEMSHDTVYYGNMNIGESSWGESSYYFVIDGTQDNYDPVIQFTVNITADNYTQTASLFLTIIDPKSNIVFRDDLEGDPMSRGWKHKDKQTGWVDQWHLSTQKNNTPGGSQSFKFGSTGSSAYADKAYGELLSPEIILPKNSIMTIRHWMDAEILEDSDKAYDGGLLMIYKDGNEELIEPSGGYPYRISISSENPLTYNEGDEKVGYPCFSGRIPWSVATFDLSKYEGQVQILFRFASDDFPSPKKYEGWYIDDILITAQKTIPPSPPVIKIAGYYDTNISVSNGGTLNMTAHVSDPNGLEDIKSVEVYYNNKT